MTNTATAPVTTAALPNKAWGWLFVSGIATLALGIFMLMAPAIASLVVTLFIGWTIAIGGIIGIIAGVTNRAEGGMMVTIVISVISLIAGGLLIFNPLSGTLTLTMLFALWLLVDGALGIGMSLITRGTGWGWWLFSSIISLLLGVWILEEMPLSALWMLGTYAGIVMLFRGMTLIFISFEKKKQAPTVEA